jgi:hypothetical protein
MMGKARLPTCSGITAAARRATNGSESTAAVRFARSRLKKRPRTRSNAAARAPRAGATLPDEGATNRLAAPNEAGGRRGLYKAVAPR